MAIITTATRKLLKLKKKIRAVSGGTGASKSYSIMMILVDYGQSNQGKKIDVVSESFPHLEEGVIKDFKDIMVSRKYWKDSHWNETKHFYNFESGSVMKFLSFDKMGKAHGPRRDVLFLNECNYLPWNTIDQLITRTRKVVWMDWNPSEEFWFHTEIRANRKDVEFVGDGGDYPPLTYLDNEGLSVEEVAEIEAHKNNKVWWKVYGEGKLGEVEGRIFTDWKFIDDVPHEARLERHWLDFGYSADPTAIGDVYYYNGGYILDEGLYQKGLSNKQIADFLLNLKKALTVADSAEPKSIDEIRSYGVNIVPADKGKDSVRQGIQMIQDQQISVTKRSTNLIKEYRNYMWMKDKDGRITKEPSPLWNHHLDGIRYAMSTLIPAMRRREILANMPRLVRRDKPQNPAK